MIWASAKNKQGFTIVELLIVVVVIAILAAITIVSYNGIQNRAKNQQTISAVRSYYTALSSYAVQNGALPANRSCLGQESFYVSNPCYQSGTTYSWNGAPDADLDSIMKTKPTTASGRVTMGTVTASGIFYDNASGALGNGYIGFPIFGSNECPSVAGAAIYGTTSAGNDIYCRIVTPSA